MMTTTWKFGDRQPEQVNDENISPEGMLRKKSMPKAEKDARKVENIGKIIKKMLFGTITAYTLGRFSTIPFNFHR